MIKSIFYLEKGKLKRGISHSKIDRIIEKNKIWVDIEKPTKEDMDFLKNKFNFHSLALEDCISAELRPKIEEYKGYIFLIFNAITFENDEINPAELNIFLGKNYLVTVHKVPLKCIDIVKEKCLKKIKIMERGVDFLLYSIVDALIDGYFPKMEEIEDKIDKLEHKILVKPKQENINHLFRMKKINLTLKKLIGPQREILNSLSRKGTSYIQETTMTYFRDVYDHSYRITDMVDIFRDLIASIMEAYLSTTSNRMNEIMKTLTVIATIMMPLTLITGIYGMNFRFMPELEFKYGYFIVWGVMVFIAVIMLFYFKKKGWI